MKKLTKFLVIISILLSSQRLLAVNARDVAIIDLSLALCLHPKMSLFDFNRIGFYKVEFGLSEEEFHEKTERLRLSAPDRSQEISALEKELEELYNERNGYSDYYVNLTEEKLKLVDKLMEESLAKEDDLKKKIFEIEYQSHNYDLTSPKETLAVVAEIEKDIFDSISQVAAEKKYSLVLNSTVANPSSYKTNYESEKVYGQGISGIDFMLFYSFIAKNNLSSPADGPPSSRDLANWLEMTRSPNALSRLPMKPYPLVLSGGNDILSDVMKKIYNKYNVDPSVYNVIESVVLKLGGIQRGIGSDGIDMKH